MSRYSVRNSGDLLDVDEDGLGPPNSTSVSPTYRSQQRYLPRNCHFSNIIFYFLIFLLGYSVALFPQFRILENGQLLPLTCPPPVHDHKLSLGSGINDHIRAAQDASKKRDHGHSSPAQPPLDLVNHLEELHSTAQQQQQQHQQTHDKFPRNGKSNLTEAIPLDIEQHTLFADRSYDPPLFYSDGVGLGRPTSERLADRNSAIHPTPALTRHSWQLAPIPDFLLDGCPDPDSLQDLPIPSPNGTDARPEILAYFPKFSPKEVMEQGWGEGHPISWRAQRELFDTMHHPLSPSAIQHNSNRDNWHMLDSLNHPEYSMKWDQYVPLVMHFQEMQAGERKCRGSTGFELRLDCYDSLTPEPNPLRNDSAESFTYRTRPHILDHGNGVYTVRILLEKPGYCQFELFLHEMVDHEGMRYIRTQPFDDIMFGKSIPPFSAYLKFPYFRTNIHVMPSQITKKFQDFAASPKGRKNAAKFMDPVTTKALSPPILDSLDSPLSSYEAQLSFALRMRRRRECSIDDYTQMTAWTGAWYKLPRDRNPCIRRREQDPFHYKENPPSPGEEEKWEQSQLTASGTDHMLGPLCSMDTYEDLEWQWPGDNPEGEPQWVYAREECYIHVFSARSLWLHWHDQRLMFQMDSNGQDLMRLMARTVFKLRHDVIQDVLPRDIMLPKLNPTQTSLDPAIVKDLLSACKDSDLQHECTLGLSNKFFDFDGYANFIGLSIWEHQQWIEQLKGRINEVSTPIGAFLINSGLHDRDLIRHGYLSPWRSGVKRRPSWSLRHSTTLVTRSVNSSFEFQNVVYSLNDRNNFDATQLNGMEPQAKTEEASSGLDDLPTIPTYLQSSMNPTTPGPASLFLANSNNSTSSGTRDLFGPPSSHLAFKLEGVLGKLEQLLAPFRKSNYEQASRITTHAIRQALRRKMDKEPNFLAPTGSVAASEQARMTSDPSSPAPPSNDVVDTLPLGPVYLWRSAPCPAGGARVRESSTTTLHIMNSEMRNVFQQKSYQTRMTYRSFVDGASATSSSQQETSREDFPLCDDVRRDSVAWIGIDMYSISYPWHWYESHSDGGHYGGNICFECNQCARCLKSNFVDHWAIFAKLHAMTLYKELQLKHAFNPHSTFTTNNCRFH